MSARAHPDKLQAAFGIPEQLTFDAGPGGLTRATVRTRHATAELFLHGAHVARYQPAGQAPVLFVSDQSLFAPDKPIRGGVPICWPWFGPNAANPSLPMHGFARVCEWVFCGACHRPDDSIRLELRLDSTPATRALWKHDFEVYYAVTVGPRLELELEVHNRCTGPITFEEALHTYLHVGDVRQVQIGGLGGTTFIDKTRASVRDTQAADMLAIAGETDRVYLDTSAEVTVRDPVLRRTLHIAKTGSRATVVWNPWVEKAAKMADFGDDEWPTMLCIETANAADHAITLPPGQSHRVTATVSSRAD